MLTVTMCLPEQPVLNDCNVNAGIIVASILRRNHLATPLGPIYVALFPCLRPPMTFSWANLNLSRPAYDISSG